MVAADRTVLIAARVGADVGEGPCWDIATRTLLFVDVTPGTIHRLDPETGVVTSRSIGQEIGAAIPRTTGGLVVAARDGIGFLADDPTAQLEIVAPIEADNPGNRMNDARCDPAGRLWAGTMAFDFARHAGSLYRVETDGRAERILSDVTISNGLGWSPAGTTMYFIDSGEAAVDAFAYDPETGAATNRRRLVEFGRGDGMPDGLTVDADGHLWVAMFGAGIIRRFSSRGVPSGQVRLPVSQVTSVAFGGDAMDTLFVTSAAYKMSPDRLAEEPLAGATFRCRPGPTGLPAIRFGG
jgi:sugar lactone lactonase YvrE